MSVVRQSLNGSWQASLASGNPKIDLPSVIPATVPGSIHTDLMQAGLIPDVFIDDNERIYAWIGYCDWTYRLEFDYAASGKAFTELVFDGIDTVAAIYLNGTLLAKVENQHRSYRFAVADFMLNGKNQLEIQFKSPIRHADEMSLQFGYRPHVNHHPYNAVRKMAANYGWDWGIDTSTVGLWKDVYLESFDQRISNVRPVLSTENGVGRAKIHVVIEGNVKGKLKAALGDQDITLHELKAGENIVELEISDPKLWWPTGEGEQNRYDLSLELSDENGVKDTFRTKVGFRDIKVQFPASDDGYGFEFHVNGKPLFIRGVNWIPNDAFVHRITKESLRRRLTQAKKANVNLIRVWGGGLYESEDFYDLCDELGLMVWQDFLFACASYSEEDLGAEVEAEARENITRIMKHPSLALWNGNNENLWGYQEWNWKQRLQGASWGEGFYFKLLPELVGELDPGRAYTPGSPYSPDIQKLHNDPSAGSVHIWDLWNQKDYPHYADYKPRFVAEFGWQGPANWSTIKESITDDPLTPESPGMLIHQKAMSGNDKLTDGLVNHFDFPNNMNDWHFAMQLNQANAIRFGLEHMRSEFPRCMGSILWQLNDCWPVTSWAAIDGAGREKPLYFAMAQCYEPFLLTITRSDAGLAVNLINNSARNLSGELSVKLLDYSGKEHIAFSKTVELAANSAESVSLGADFSDPTYPESSLVLATFDQSRALYFFSEYKDSLLTLPELKTSLDKTESGYQLSVTASNVVRDLLLMVDKVDEAASVDQGLVTLLPGESAKFVITTTKNLELSELVAPEVLRSANQLVGRSK